MKQTINLYASLPKEITPTLSVRYFPLILLTWVIMLLGVWGYAKWHIRTLNNQMTTLNETFTLRQEQMSKLKALEPGVDLTHLKQQIDQLNTQVAQESQFVASISAQKKKADTGFAPYLTALAEEVPNGLWLTKIEIMDSGAHINLIGQTQKSGDLLLFMDRLQQTKAFQGKYLRLLTVTGHDQQPSSVQEPSEQAFNRFEVTATNE
jgi:MSHA biogenesis protein MshI